MINLFKSNYQFCIRSDNNKHWFAYTLKDVVYYYENKCGEFRVSTLGLYYNGFEYIGKYNSIEELKLEFVEELI